MGRYSSSNNDLGDGFAGAYMGIAIVLLILLIFFLVKAVNLLIRVFVAHPKNKALWITLVIFVVCTVLTIIFRGSIVFGIPAILSFLLLLLIARVIELYYSETFQEKTPLIESVLHRPWWQGSQQQLAA